MVIVKKRSEGYVVEGYEGGNKLTFHVQMGFLVGRLS
jgi:hypothetical protein